jgi:two-component system chemotaxis sensor kinase CheA
LYAPVFAAIASQPVNEFNAAEKPVMDDLLSEFLAEALEGIEVLDAELVTLEQNPNDPALLGSIFRVLHTIKGTSGFLDLPRLESVAHAGENILGKFRDGELEVTPTAVTLILESIDAIKVLVAAIGETGAEPAGDDAALIAKLNAWAEGNTDEAVPAAEDAEAKVVEEGEAVDETEVDEPAADDDVNVYESIGGLSTLDGVFDSLYRRVLADDRLQPIYSKGDVDVLQLVHCAHVCEAIGGPKADTNYNLATVHADMVNAGLDDEHFDAVFAHLASALEELEVSATATAKISEVFADSREAVLRGTAAPTDEAAEETPVDTAEIDESPAENVPVETKSAPPVAVQSIRVNVDVLESLMTVVSELVLTRNQLMQILRDQRKSEFDGPLQRLNQVTSELQESVMQTRMQPIGNAWGKLPRIVRDLSQELDKKIDLEMIGAETELDRQVLELIRDPLTHMIRNSGDHGLETPAERVAAGKPEMGTITLSARHEGGHIIIEIKDDGRGLPVEKIKNKAITNGLVTEAEVETLSDQQILQFIFKPGLSTAEAVTNVSGRGVGMDVVRSNITKIGGTVELQSTEGKGTRFIIKIPLTLAIVSALIVESCGDRYAMPQNSVTELVRTTESSGHKIENINNTPVLRLRNRLLPLVSLKALLNTEKESENEETYVIVTQVGTFSFGIMVDRVFDTEEIVVKPVARNLRDVALFSGNTILGDGSVVMILDPNGIAASSSGLGAVQSDDDADAEAHELRGDDKTSLLVFRAGDNTPKAFPLELVARIEEIDLANVEYANGSAMIQYRDHLMPLVSVDGNTSVNDNGNRPVLVFADRDRSMGLMVDQIVDIVESAVEIETKGAVPGTIGSAIIDGKATDLLDASHYMRLVGQNWSDAESEVAFGDDVESRRVLLVDDSPFFRNMLTPLLRAAGYDIETVENAQAAMKLLDKDGNFDAIVSDIEMPGMNGFEFVAALRNEDRWRDTPVVALSSHGTEKDVERGREAGFNDYVIKMDHDGLLNALSVSTETASKSAA